MADLDYAHRLARNSQANSGYPTRIKHSGPQRYFIVEATPEGDFEKGPFAYAELISTLEVMGKPRPPLSAMPYQWKGHG